MLLKFSLLFTALLQSTNSLLFHNLKRINSLNKYYRSIHHHNNLLMTSFESNNKDNHRITYDRILDQSNAWCGLNGLMYTDGKYQWNPAPISLIPNLFNKEAYKYVLEIQPIWNKLIDLISRDHLFLLENLVHVSDSDSFTKRLIELYKTLDINDLQTQLQCGILRSDYMINYDQVPLQVEINTISSSFGYLSKKVSDFHYYLLDRNIDSIELKSIIHEVNNNNDLIASYYHASNVLENPSQTELAKCLAMAHKEYNNDNAIILFVVQPGERNIADQRSFAAKLWNEYHIKVEFMTLKQISESIIISNQNNKKQQLIIKQQIMNSQESHVSVVYYRAGYSPNDYPTEIEWNVRSYIETTNSIKCPNVGYQLAGTKAIQATLCKPDILEKFLTSKECELLRKCFAQQYSIADLSIVSKDDQIIISNAIQDAIQNGTNWVLKPQREGGGNNFYGTELSEFLKINQKNLILQGYVLMKRIFPLPQKSAFLRSGKLQVLPSISELGIYGTYLSYGNNNTVTSTQSTNITSSSTTNIVEPILNSYGGYLLRTKPDGVDEGGVASGYSVLSSVILE